MIPFTQYLLPDGRPCAGGFNRPAEIERMADSLIASGARFEAEVLRDLQVSLTCERDDAEGETEVLAIEVEANDSRLLYAVDKLITEAFAASRLNLEAP